MSMEGVKMIPTAALKKVLGEKKYALERLQFHTRYMPDESRSSERREAFGSMARQIEILSADIAELEIVLRHVEGTQNE